MASYLSSRWRWFATLFCLLAFGCAHAVDHAVLDRAASSSDFRADYAKELLLEVLERTVPSSGLMHLRRVRPIWSAGGCCGR